MMVKRLLIVIVILFSGTLVDAQRLPTEQYIAMYKEIAIREMKRSGIPASITLAQGILESGSGNSRLATKGNNHFGIKCHDWTGRSMREHDDRRNECFRKYKSADDSFIDHSNFLTSRRRYAELFTLGRTDYKAWAHGLKKAGYATAPDYAERLIRLIERYDLHQYDVVGRTFAKKIRNKMARDVQNPEPSSNIASRIRFRNNVPYFIVNQGDSFETVKRQLGIRSKKIIRYNDFEKNHVLRVGEPVYLKKKKKRTPRRYSVHVADGTETLHEISQRYAVRLSKLLENNKMKAEQRPYEGQHILLR